MYTYYRLLLARLASLPVFFVGEGGGEEVEGRENLYQNLRASTQ